MAVIVVNNLDIIILNKKSTSTSEWVSECISSVNDIGNTYILENEENNIAKLEVESIKNTNNKYFGFLDNDDTLVSENIPKMIRQLEKDDSICGVYSNYERIDASGNKINEYRRGSWSPSSQLCSGDYPNHFAIYRRSALDMNLVESTYINFNEYYRFVLSSIAANFGYWKHIPIIAYKRRERDYYINHRRKISDTVRNNAMKIAIPILTKYLK